MSMKVQYYQPEAAILASILLLVSGALIGSCVFLLNIIGYIALALAIFFGLAHLLWEQK